MPPRAWNVIHVKRSDENVFEALACDSFSLKVDIWHSPFGSYQQPQ